MSAEREKRISDIMSKMRTRIERARQFQAMQGLPADPLEGDEEGFVGLTQSEFTVPKDNLLSLENRILQLREWLRRKSGFKDRTSQGTYHYFDSEEDGLSIGCLEALTEQYRYSLGELFSLSCKLGDANVDWKIGSENYGLKVAFAKREEDDYFDPVDNIDQFLPPFVHPKSIGDMTDEDCDIMRYTLEYFVEKKINS